MKERSSAFLTTALVFVVVISMLKTNVLYGADITAQENSSGLFFSESFDDMNLVDRGWYDGSKFKISGKDAYAGKEPEIPDDADGSGCQREEAHGRGEARHETGDTHAPDDDEQGLFLGQAVIELFIVAMDQMNRVGDAVHEQEARDDIADQVDFLPAQGHEAEEHEDAGNHGDLRNVEAQGASKGEEQEPEPNGRVNTDHAA